jgi:hypothetical protein
VGLAVLGADVISSITGIAFSFGLTSAPFLSYQAFFLSYRAFFNTLRAIKFQYIASHQMRAIKCETSNARHQRTPKTGKDSQNRKTCHDF